MSESINNQIPSHSVINSADVVMDDKALLNFPLLSQVEELKEQIKQDAHLKINPIAQAELLKTVNYLSSLVINKVALYFSPENTKTAIHKQAIELCLKNNAAGWQKAETAVKQAESKLITLKTEFAQIKQAVATIESLLKGPAATLVSSQQKMNQNMADIKALELVLQPTLTKLYFIVSAAQAIDSTLIKHVFDLKQQSPEYVVLNKDSYVDTVGLFIKASQIMQNGSSQLHQLNEILTQKVAAFNKIKAEFDAFTKTLPTYPSADQLQHGKDLCDEVQAAIQEHAQVKAQIKPLEEQRMQAEKYLKYYENWTEQAQEEIDAAKLIETKKQENVELAKLMQTNLSLDAQIEPHLQKLAHTDTQIKEQQKIVLDNQILLKMHQEATDYFKSETAAKLIVLATSEAETIVDVAPTTLPLSVSDTWAVQLSSTEPQL